MNGACDSLSSELCCDFLILESESKSGQGRYQKTLGEQLSSRIDRKMAAFLQTSSFIPLRWGTPSSCSDSSFVGLSPQPTTKFPCGEFLRGNMRFFSNNNLQGNLKWSASRLWDQ